MSAGVVDKFVALLALFAFGVVLAAETVLYQFCTELTFVVLSNAISFLACHAEDRRVAGKALWKRICAFYADVAISVEEVTIEAGLTLILGFASKAICKARRAFFLLSNEEGLIAFFTSYVSDTNASKAERDQLIAKLTHSILREVRVLAASAVGP